ncbi:MAG: hypothetical protein JKX79_12495 [Labilibaculum sp.]|nr:hypothetical protein [Labilibaculum sp.]
MKKLIVLFFIFLSIPLLKATEKGDIVVATDGTGDFKTITEAIGNLSMYNYQRLVIYVKNGVYNEKIRIEKDYLTIRGESRENTIIEYSQLRSDWKEKPDFTGPAVINIHADDVVLDQLTIRNTQPQLGPHAFTIYGTGTRTIITNCTVTSKGGDTVSLWNYKNGMYYHANCYFEGCVDFVCPRGWCFIRDSQFNQLKKTATLWHAAVANKDQKFVLRNCKFTGVEGYSLGRHHYEAQFVLIDCQFSKEMADKPIYYHQYKDHPEKNRPYFWRDRYYFYNCTKEEQAYSWYANNLRNAEPPIHQQSVSASWAFDGLWNPEEKSLPYIIKYEINKNQLTLQFNELVGVDPSLLLETSTGKKISFVTGQGRNKILLKSNQILTPADFEKSLDIRSGRIFGIRANIYERVISDSINLRGLITDVE